MVKRSSFTTFLTQFGGTPFYENTKTSLAECNGEKIQFCNISKFACFVPVLWEKNIMTTGLKILMPSRCIGWRQNREFGDIREKSGNFIYLENQGKVGEIRKNI
ncbi:hypothetical protein AVEN_64789-1 [Araneus ventricosus]|uniref:Uncharacterized protein n=1 Tax=Araneus ventricosus TaxID=182803 RepID=A0A4Y2S2L7_ARAVE|nr:hypothetical protein AVEN_64789-1 [Araneus ventricosus]